MTELHPALRENVRLLGEILGDCIREKPGPEWFERVEEVRQAAKSDRMQESGSGQRLGELLSSLTDDQLVPVTRAFNQFLNLANLAEQYHGIRRHRDHETSVEPVRQTLSRLAAQGVSRQRLHECIRDMRLEFVLTAHPTEVARRTLIMKYDEMSACLERLDREDLLEEEREAETARLRQLITQAWNTDEIRHERPTAVDEARWGFAVIENSLWEALPSFLNELDEGLLEETGERLPLSANPIRIASWMGGDRDGNPNVTSEVTREVLLLSRWMAADLFLRDLQRLRAELSMWEATPELQERVGGHRDPYRALLSELRDRLEATRDWAGEAVRHNEAPDDRVLFESADLIEPLQLCYDSPQGVRHGRRCGRPAPGHPAPGLLLWAGTDPAGHPSGGQPSYLPGHCRNTGSPGDGRLRKLVRGGASGVPDQGTGARVPWFRGTGSRPRRPVKCWIPARSSPVRRRRLWGPM